MRREASAVGDCTGRSETRRSVIVTLGVAMVCALCVSVAVVVLRPYYLANLDAARIGRLETMITALNEAGHSVAPENVEAAIVDLQTGWFDNEVDPLTYDQRDAVRNPRTSISIPAEMDVAGMKRRENHAVIYLARDNNGQTIAVIVPLWGVGYQSAIYGYLALATDGREILAMDIYEHGETPGLGSQIQDERWSRQWPGKQAFDSEGNISVHVGGGDAANRIDAISGATRTSMGVNGILQFWLGELGFAPFLEQFRQQEGRS